MSVTSAIDRLRAFSRRPSASHAACDLCRAKLDPEHEHLVEIKTGDLSCCCSACATLFGTHSSVRFRRVPRDVMRLTDFAMTDAQWQNLSIPIGLAFLCHVTRAEGVMAVYPSPAGGTQSQPMPEAWQSLVNANPVLAEFTPDAEALLVNRLDGSREYYRAPIDECYRLVGIVRLKWRGFTGGTELWDEVSRFLSTLKERATPCPT